MFAIVDDRVEIAPPSVAGVEIESVTWQPPVGDAKVDTFLLSSDRAALETAIAAQRPTAGQRILIGRIGDRFRSFVVEDVPLLALEDVAAASLDHALGFAPAVRLALTKAGEARLAQGTATRAGKRMAIVVDGLVDSTPYLVQPLKTSSLLAALSERDVDGHRAFIRRVHEAIHEPLAADALTAPRDKPWQEVSAHGMRALLPPPVTTKIEGLLHKSTGMLGPMIFTVETRPFPDGPRDQMWSLLVEAERTRFARTGLALEPDVSPKVSGCDGAAFRGVGAEVKVRVAVVGCRQAVSVLWTFDDDAAAPEIARFFGSVRPR